MSTAIYMESICDKCGNQTRTRIAQQDSPLPHGWCGVRVGAAMSRHLCEQCTAQLREWLGMGPEVP